MARKKPGRPPLYDHKKKADIVLFQKRLAEYFSDRDIKSLPYTVSGIALGLNMCDKSVLYAYRDRHEPFCDMVKRALLMVEQQHEEKLSTRQSVTGNIFALKNMGWSDKQEIDVHGEVDITIVTGIPSPEDDEEEDSWQ